MNLCLQTGEVPDKWKIAQIYLIPKGTDWEFNLNNVRPIALLETFRKCITRVFTKRLSRILVKKNILKGPNFAGLPGDSTETPVHILNSIMEYAKEEKKELWLLFQDMSKAFDSVLYTCFQLHYDESNYLKVQFHSLLIFFRSAK